MSNLKKRILTSVILISLVSLAFFYTFMLLVLLILVSTFTWIEFNNLINRLISKNIFSKFFFKLITFIYLLFFSYLIFKGITQDQFSYRLNIIYILLICICSDTGGFIFGKTFKGKKLTKISPKKTVAGSIGSFILSLALVPIFHFALYSVFNNTFHLILLAFVISFICQAGDLFISFLKRKANLKDTGDLLPGHGGVLDRIDGIIFAVPCGIILWKFLL